MDIATVNVIAPAIIAGNQIKPAVPAVTKYVGHRNLKQRRIKR